MLPGRNLKREDVADDNDGNAKSGDAVFPDVTLLVFLIERQAVGLDGGKVLIRVFILNRGGFCRLFRLSLDLVRVTFVGRLLLFRGFLRFDLFRGRDRSYNRGFLFLFMKVYFRLDGFDFLRRDFLLFLFGNGQRLFLVSEIAVGLIPLFLSGNLFSGLFYDRGRLNRFFFDRRCFDLFFGCFLFLGFAHGYYLGAYAL